MTDPTPYRPTVELLSSSGAVYATAPLGADGVTVFDVPARWVVSGYRLRDTEGRELYRSQPRTERYTSAGVYTVRFPLDLAAAASPVIEHGEQAALRLHEQLDRLHVAAPPDRTLLDVARDLAERGARVLDCDCTPYPYGTGPEEQCPLHGRSIEEWADWSSGLDQALRETREELRAARRAGETWAREQLDRAAERDAARTEAAELRAEVARLRRQLDEVHG